MNSILIILYIVVVVLTLYTIIKNKKLILTFGLIFIVTAITYLVNSGKLNYSGGFVGIHNGVFFLLSCIFMIIMIIAKFKYQIKERNFSFICSIILTILLFALSRPLYGGLMLEGEEYFKRNLNSYLASLTLLIINVNLFVNYISFVLPSNRLKNDKIGSE